MLGSRIANRELFARLSGWAPFTDEVPAERIQRGVRFRQGTVFPACLFYPEFSAYDSGGTAVPAEHITGEQLRYVVRVDGPGDSDAAIARAAEAQLEALAGYTVTTDDGYFLTFVASGEVPLTSYVDGDQPWQRLGTVYTVTIDRVA